MLVSNKIINLPNVGYNAHQTIAKRLFSDMKMKYLQVVNINVPVQNKITVFMERISQKEHVHTKGPLIKDYVSLSLLSTLFHRVRA